MRIHTNTITRPELFAALPKPEMYLKAMEHGSRSHAQAWEVRLVWLGPKVKGDKRGKTNSGNYGAGSSLACSYDEWGEWIARLYEIDDSAKIGPYTSAEHFHAQTDGDYMIEPVHCGSTDIDSAGFCNDCGADTN